MSAHHYYIDDAGDPVEITDRIQFDSWKLTENAEEASVATSEVVVDDPEMDLDEIQGHRGYYVIEDATGDDEVIFYGYIADQTISRGDYPLGRQWTLSLVDINSLIDKRIMTGSDCNRDAETDVARMLWLLTTDEAHAFHSDTTYISTANPVDMDACDYRGQRLSQVVDDCEQASGKNAYLFWSSPFTGGTRSLWYGANSLTTRQSPLGLSNDLADIDDATTFAISEDTKLVRDPSRMYSGIYLPYDGGAIYKSGLYPETAFSWFRDGAMPSLNVKSETKASARAVRYLNDLHTQEHRIQTAVILPNTNVNDIRPGMFVPFKGTHLPGYETAINCRVLNRTVGQWTHDQYLVELELSPVGDLSTCATVISAAHITTAEAYYWSGGPNPWPVSVPISNPEASVTIGLALQNRDTGTMTVDAGWTSLRVSNNGVESWAMVERAGVTTESLDISIALVTPDHDWFDAMIVALPTAASSAVQFKYDETIVGAGVTFDAAPTPGNIMVMLAWEKADDITMPTVTIGDGWGSPVAAFDRAFDPFGHQFFLVYLRCIEEDDPTGPWGVTPATGGGAATVYFVAEYEVA